MQTQTWARLAFSGTQLFIEDERGLALTVMIATICGRDLCAHDRHSLRKAKM